MSTTVTLDISLPDAKALLTLLESTNTFPDVVDDLRNTLADVPGHEVRGEEE